jgi:hypothetical protein
MGPLVCLLVKEQVDRVPTTMPQRQFVLHGAKETGWFLFLVLAVAAAVVCIALLYRYERRLVSRPLGFGLLTLRLLAVLVVFATLLEPVLTWSIDREKTGRVVVAVDVSQSMETADKHASPAEKLRLVRALGMQGNEATNERLDRWIEDYENGREPEWVAPGETHDPQRALQLAADRRDLYLGVMRDVERIPRKEIARRLLTTGNVSLADRIDQLALLELSVFAGQAAQAERQTLDGLVATPPETLRIDASDLTSTISASLSTSDQAPLAGIVVFTDGRDNAHPDATQLLARLRGAGVPIYPVLVGSQQRPKDLAIASIDAPITVYENDHPVARVILRTTGFEGQPVTVRLTRERDETAANAPEGTDPQPAEIASRTVTPDGPSTTIEFDLDAGELGRQRYVVSTEVLPGETRSDNNSKKFSFQVVDDEADVLVLEGEARWEFRYLEAALKRDEHVKVERVVFRQPYMGVLPDTFFPRTLDLPADPAAQTGSPFAPFDVVIVGDVAPHQVQIAGWDLLDRYVREEGGTLVLIAGKRFMPLGYRSDTLNNLLPVENLRKIEMSGADQTGAPADRGFHLQLTPDGETQAMLQLDPDEVENRRIWSSLPGHPWGLRGEAKPGCSVWAAATRPGAAPDLQAERENAIIVQQYVGAGQVLWIGIDSTWRWRNRVGDQYHHRFWGQIARWAAEFKATAGNEFVRFGPERPVVLQGDDALFLARWTEPFLRRNPELKARAEISRAEDPDHAPVMTIDLTPTETRPLVHSGRATGLAAGEYRARLVVENANAGAEEIAAELTVTERVTTELSELTANRDLLEQIADATGGRLFYPDQLDELPRPFEGLTETESLREEVPLWDHWFTLLLLCGVLGTEWVLRKLNGLP